MLALCWHNILLSYSYGDMFGAGLPRVSSFLHLLYSKICCDSVEASRKHVYLPLQLSVD